MWESGEALPTLAQARAMAKLYRRPFAVFFLAEPPRDFQVPLVDFRGGEQSGTEYSTSLRTLIRLTMMRQEWVREIIKQERRAPMRWVGSARQVRDVEALAKRVREQLVPSWSAIESLDSQAAAFQYWCGLVESQGVFVFQSGGPLAVETEEARGFALVDPFAPFVMVNGADSHAGRIFTLIHELVHLWVGASGVSDTAPIRHARSADQRIEQFCNRVAAEALLPTAVFLKKWTSVGDSSDMQHRVEAVASRVRLSRDMVARRAVDAGKITWEAYAILHGQYAEEWNRARKKQREKSGGPTWTLMVPKRAGVTFTRRVLAAFDSGELAGAEVVELLNTKLNHLDQIAEQVGLAGRFRGPAA